MKRLNTKICIIHSYSKIESLYTLFPIVVSPYRKLVKFIPAESENAKSAEGDCVIIVGGFKKYRGIENADEAKRKDIEDYKKRFKRVVFFDDSDGSDNLQTQLIDLFDLYFKGKLLADRKLYMKPMYGRQYYSDYYHQQFGISDKVEKIRPALTDEKQLDKLRLSWNLGCGIYPLPGKTATKLLTTIVRYGAVKNLSFWYHMQLKKLVAELQKPINTKDRIKKVQSRYTISTLPDSVGHQRKFFLEILKTNPNALTGKVHPSAYSKELRNVSAVVSPFGWGEVCFRDFETIINGNILIKPEMEHVETWPDVYKSHETYVPVKWDGSDLENVIEDVVKNSDNYQQLIHQARSEYAKDLLAMNEKVRVFLEESLGEKIAVEI